MVENKDTAGVLNLYILAPTSSLAKDIIFKFMQWVMHFIFGSRLAISLGDPLNDF